ncbi:MAG: diacylglycerol kinase family lipid kinase [Muribaculaceae bacterium]|nr:diacylglycerol kinase family lipid kinase [Muribaculaceae bacterium]
MMTDRLMLIINPISGTAGKAGMAEMVTRHLMPLGHDIDVRYTTCGGDATRLAREAVDLGYRGVLAAGGDGTINETARALCGTGVPLGIIPAGSGNGLARHTGIPIDPELSLEIIKQEHLEEVDYGTVNESEFFCTMGVGFDAAVSHRFARQHRRGKLMYVKSAINEFASYSPETYTLSANGKLITQRAFLIAVANASQYGNNAYIAPEASITDGLLDVTIIHQGNPLETARVGIDMMTGYINKNMLIETFRTPSVVIYRESGGPAHIDGEPVDMGPILDIRCHHAALRMFTPRHHASFKPLLTPIASTLSDWRITLRHLLHI